MKRTVLPILYSLLIVAFPAYGQFSLCNDLQKSTFSAFAFEHKGELISFGWQQLESGECHILVPDQLTARNIDFELLDKIWIHSRDQLDSPNVEVGGGSEFCIDDFFDIFLVEFADSTCSKRGYNRASFFLLDLDAGADSGLIRLTNQGFIFHS